MALNQIKEQVLVVLQSVLSLDSSQQIEAMGFLQDCLKNLGLTLPENSSFKGDPPDKDEYKTLACTSDSAIKSESSMENTVPPIGQDSENGIHSVETKDKSCFDQTLTPPKSEENITTNYINRTMKRRTNKPFTKKTGKKTAGQLRAKNRELDSNIMDFHGSYMDRIVTEEQDKFPDPANESEIQSRRTEMYKCPGCFTIHKNKADFIIHVKTHDDSSMSCRMCKKLFNGVIQFWQHQKNGKCKLLDLQCSECNEKFKHRRHYLKHVLGHKDNNCRYCEEKFSTWAQYKNHLKEHHPTIKMERDLIPCKFCSMSFHRHVGLYNHYRLKHSKGKFVCLSCGLLLPTKEKHKEHVLIHESEKNWKCKICKMKFYRRQQLLLHVSIHKLGIYKCLTCDITVTSKTDLHKHKKEGHEVKGLEKKFECDICHKTFDKRFTLGNHLATHSKEKCYTCKYCVKSFRTLDSLNRHQKRKSHFEKAKIVIPESKYEKVYEDKLICEKCGKQYKTQRELKCHLIVHKSIYDCNECGKKFTLKNNLTKHLRRHRNPVNVVCELCGDTFNQLSALNEHCLMKHSDVRKAKCDICQKTFKRKSELNRHLRTHEFKRPFACFCGKAYKQSAHLQNHYKSAHGSQKQTTLIENAVEEFQSDQVNPIFREGNVEKRKKVFESEPENLVSLEGMESVNVFRPSSSYIGIQLNENHDNKVPYVPNYGMRYPQNDMEPINVNYDDLNFGSTQTDKRGLVFASPAVDLSMVTMSEVVQNGIQIGEEHHRVEEPFNKISDDNSQIQLLNLSEHIVQEYLLNLQ